MKKLKILFGLFFVLISSMVSAQEELQSYLRIAAENNPGLKAKFDTYMAALEVIPQVKALPDPQMAFAYFIQPVETRVGPQRFKFSASQMFPWFGTLKTKENVAVQAAKSKFEIFNEFKSRLLNDVKATYFNLYFNRKAIVITLGNIRILDSFQKLALIKIEAGLVSPLDEYRIEMEINELENQLALLKDQQNYLEVSFKELLNVNNHLVIHVPDDMWLGDFPLSRAAALDSISSMNHQLLALDLKQESLGYQKDLTKLMGKPNFKLGFDYTLIGKGSNDLAGKDAFVFPVVGISIPIYRDKYKAMVKQAVYLESANSNERADKTSALTILFERGWKDYLDAGRRITLFEKQLLLSQQSLSLLETDYATGNVNFEEILRMERKVLKYNLEQEKAKADKQAAISFINYLMGK